MSTVLSGDYATDTPPSGSYTAENSTWNVGNLVNGTGYTESLTLNNPNSPNINTTISWNFPNTPAGGNVYSYPAVHYGQYAGYDTPATSIAAEQVNNIKTLTLSDNISLSGQTGQYDAIYDGFLTSAPGFTGSSTVQDEFEVYLHTPSYTQGYIESLQQHTFTDSQGIKWIIANGGPGGGSEDQIIFAPANFQDLTNNTIDLKALLQAAAADGVISGNDYFNGLALGNEPREGSGGMTINSFTVNYDGDPNGATSTAGATGAAGTTGTTGTTGTGDPTGTRSTTHTSGTTGTTGTTDPTGTGSTTHTSGTTVTTDPTGTGSTTQTNGTTGTTDPTGTGSTTQTSGTTGATDPAGTGSTTHTSGTTGTTDPTGTGSTTHTSGATGTSDPTGTGTTHHHHTGGTGDPAGAGSTTQTSGATGTGDPTGTGSTTHTSGATGTGDPAGTGTTHHHHHTGGITQTGGTTSIGDTTGTCGTARASGTQAANPPATTSGQDASSNAHQDAGAHSAHDAAIHDLMAFIQHQVQSFEHMWH